MKKKASVITQWVCIVGLLLRTERWSIRSGCNVVIYIYICIYLKRIWPSCFFFIEKHWDRLAFFKDPRRPPSRLMTRVESYTPLLELNASEHRFSFLKCDAPTSFSTVGWHFTNSKWEHWKLLVSSMRICLFCSLLLCQRTGVENTWFCSRSVIFL